jgi:single-strand DNA-binding protein
VAWGKSAELVEKMLQKGTEVVVEGKIATRSYEKDGMKRYATEIVLNELLVLSKKNAQ